MRIRQTPTPNNHHNPELPSPRKRAFLLHREINLLKYSHKALEPFKRIVYIDDVKNNHHSKRTITMGKYMLMPERRKLVKAFPDIASQHGLEPVEITTNCLEWRGYSYRFATDIRITFYAHTEKGEHKLCPFLACRFMREYSHEPWSNPLNRTLYYDIRTGLGDWCGQTGKCNLHGFNRDWDCNRAERTIHNHLRMMIGIPYEEEKAKENRELAESGKWGPLHRIGIR